MRPSPRRLLKIAIRSWRSRLSKSADFGGTFIPLAGKLFSVTEIVSGNGKHSLLFAFCKYVGFRRRFLAMAEPCSHGSAHLAYRKRSVRSSDGLLNRPP